MNFDRTTTQYDTEDTSVHDEMSNSVPGHIRITPERHASPGAPQSNASLGTLLRELAHEVPALLRNEVALAKSEMRENARTAGKAVATMAVGGAIAMAGLVVLMMAGVYALSNIFDPWFSALLIGGGAIIIGGLMAKGAKEKLSDESLAPERSIDSLKKDKQALKGELQ